jgi:hypothetical protein
MDFGDRLMGTTITISLNAKSDDFYTIFLELLDRLATCASLTEAKIHNAFWRRDIQKLKISTDISESLLNIEVSELLASKNALELNINYRLSSGRLSGITVYLIGSQFENGSEVNIDSHLKICIPHNQVSRPLRNLLPSSEKYISEDLIARESGNILIDWEEIFIKFCGIHNDRRAENLVKHAAMYLESGWPSAVGCAMLYHSQLEEFMKDFLRIYAEYHVGYRGPKMFSASALLKGQTEEKPPEALRPGKETPKFYTQFDMPNNASIINFLNNLSERRAAELANHSVTDLRRFLMNIIQYLPEIKYRDFGRYGAALLVDPLSSIWRVYYTIATQLQ